MRIFGKYLEEDVIHRQFRLYKAFGMYYLRLTNSDKDAFSPDHAQGLIDYYLNNHHEEVNDRPDFIRRVVTIYRTLHQLKPMLPFKGYADCYSPDGITFYQMNRIVKEDGFSYSTEETNGFFACYETHEDRTTSFCSMYVTEHNAYVFKPAYKFMNPYGHNHAHVEHLNKTITTNYRHDVESQLLLNGIALTFSLASYEEHLIFLRNIEEENFNFTPLTSKSFLKIFKVPQVDNYFEVRYAQQPHHVAKSYLIKKYIHNELHEEVTTSDTGFHNAAHEAMHILHLHAARPHTNLSWGLEPKEVLSITSNLKRQCSHMLFGKQSNPNKRKKVAYFQVGHEKTRLEIIDPSTHVLFKHMAEKDHPRPTPRDIVVNFGEVRKNARIISQGQRSENCFFKMLPNETLVKIAADTAIDKRYCSEKDLHEVAYHHLSRPL